jgi:hypothetical protein
MSSALRRARIALAPLALLGLLVAAARCSIAGKECEPIGCTPFRLEVLLTGRALVAGDAVRVSWIDGGVGYGITCTTSGCAQPTGGLSGSAQAASLFIEGQRAPTGPLLVTVEADGIELTKQSVTLAHTAISYGDGCGSCDAASGSLSADLSKAPSPAGDAGSDASSDASSDAPSDASSDAALCGARACVAGEICVVPCCGGANPGDAAPCVPASPYCATIATSCGGTPACACMGNVCGPAGGCGGMLGDRLQCVCF